MLMEISFGQKKYGGGSSGYFDYVTAIKQTRDGGISWGYSESFGTNGYDILILKLDSNGSIIWKKLFAASYGDYVKSLQQTADGGYAAQVIPSHSALV